MVTQGHIILNHFLCVRSLTQSFTRRHGVCVYAWRKTSLGCPAALAGCCWFCSSHSGAPPWTICSRNHTRLIKAQSVQVTTKQPCRQSASRFSLHTHCEMYTWHVKNCSVYAERDLDCFVFFPRNIYYKWFPIMLSTRNQTSFISFLCFFFFFSHYTI